MVIYSINISPFQEGHQSTERAILFIKNNQTVIRDPYLIVNAVGGQLWPLHAWVMQRNFVFNLHIYPKNDVIKGMTVIPL